MNSRTIRRSIVMLALAGTSCGSCDDEVKGDNSVNGEPNNGAMSNNATNNGSPNNSSSNNANAQNGDFIDQTRDEYCMGEGPPIIVGDQGSGREAVCTGDLAQTTFRYGLCVCEDFEVGNTISTDGFNSDVGATSQNDKSGAVGVNGDFSVGNSALIGGTLWVAGAGGVTANNGLTINNRLYANGSVTSTTVLSVDDDATVGGDLTANSITIGGTLRLPDGSTIDTNNPQIGEELREPVNVSDPCECDNVFDISAFVANHRDNNHNDDIGLDAGVLTTGESSLTLDLPCGVFYLDGGMVTNTLRINVTGRTALFIGGDLEAGNSVLATLEPGSEFDLFVEGNIDVTNGMSLGSPEQPAAARMYVGGTNVNLGNGGQFAGNLYAPRATVTVGNSIEIFGSMFVGEFEGGNSFIVHYDSAILTAGDDCEGGGGGSGNNGGGGGMCSDCTDCGNQACTDGVCGECQSDADCCSPLICYQGDCMLVIN